MTQPVGTAAEMKRHQVYGRGRTTPIHNPHSMPPAGRTTAAKATEVARPPIAQMNYEQANDRFAELSARLFKLETQKYFLDRIVENHGTVTNLQNIPSKRIFALEQIDRFKILIADAAIEGDTKKVAEYRRALSTRYAEVEVMGQILTSTDGTINSTTALALVGGVNDKRGELQRAITQVQIELGRVEKRRGEFKRGDELQGAALGGTASLAERAERITSEEPEVLDWKEAFWTTRYWKDFQSLSPGEKFGKIVGFAFLCVFMFLSDAISMITNETLRSILTGHIVNGTVGTLANNAVDQAFNERNMEKLVNFASEALERFGIKLTAEAVEILQSQDLHNAVVSFATNLIESDALLDSVGKVLTGNKLRRAINTVIDGAFVGVSDSTKKVLADPRLRGLLVDFISGVVENTASNVKNAATAGASDMKKAATGYVAGAAGAAAGKVTSMASRVFAAFRSGSSDDSGGGNK